MPICRTCGEDKKKHASGQCGQCYGREYQRAKRARWAKKARQPADFDSLIYPRSIMHMKPGEIIANWNKILRGAGL